MVIERNWKYVFTLQFFGQSSLQNIPVYMEVQDDLIIIAVYVTVSSWMFYMEAVFLYFEN